MSAGYGPASPALVVEDPSAPAPVLPERLRVRLGPLRFSGTVVGPDHPYVLDCWAAVVGPTQVLCLARLHQLVGTETIDARAVATSIGLGGADWQSRLGWCLGKLTRYQLVSFDGTLIELSPAIRILTEPELAAAGDLVSELHEGHLAAACARRPRRSASHRQGTRE